MPDMDGLTLARELPATTARPHLLLLSSSGAPAAEATEAGIAAVLQKPVRAANLHMAIAEALGRAAPTSESQTPRSREHALRILLAEDNVVNQTVAKLVLGKLGYSDVDVVSNGVEAVEAIAQTKYDVVLMDVQMPRMDGLEATRAICARWSRNDRPALIAMTAHALPGIASAASTREWTPMSSSQSSPSCSPRSRARRAGAGIASRQLGTDPDRPSTTRSSSGSPRAWAATTRSLPS